MFRALPKYNCKVILHQTNTSRTLFFGSSPKVNSVQTPFRDDGRVKNLTGADNSRLNSKQLEEVDGTSVVQNDLLRLPQAIYTTSFADNFELPVTSSPGLITSRAPSDSSSPEPLRKSKLSVWPTLGFINAFKICLSI